MIYNQLLNNYNSLICNAVCSDSRANRIALRIVSARFLAFLCLIMLGTPSDLGEGALPRSARPGECVHRSAPAKGTIIFDLLLLIGIFLIGVKLNGSHWAL